MKYRLQIPDDESLVGKTLSVRADHSIRYPELVGIATGVNRYTFKNSRTGVDKRIRIEMSYQPVSASERRWLDSREGTLTRAVQVAGLAGFFVGLFFLWRLIVAKSRR